MNERSARVLGQQQFYGGVCVTQAAKRIQTRRKRESDGFFGQCIECGASKVCHHFESKAVCGSQGLDAFLRQRAGFIFEQRHICNEAEGNEVEQICGRQTTNHRP